MTAEDDIPDLERARRDAISHHDALRESGVMNRVELAEYRCRRGCSLLRVWQTPSGPEFYADTKHARAFHTMIHSYIDVRGQDRNQAGIPRFGIPDIWAGRLNDHPVDGWVPLICDHYQGGAQISDVRGTVSNRQPGDPARILIDAPAVS